MNTYLQKGYSYRIMETVKSLEDIIETLSVIDEAYKKRELVSIQISIKGGQPINELRDTPTREILKSKFNIKTGASNNRIQKLLNFELIEVDPQRSYQGYKAYQRIYRLTGKGLQMLMINSDSLNKK